MRVSSHISYAYIEVGHQRHEARHAVAAEGIDEQLRVRRKGMVVDGSVWTVRQSDFGRDWR